MEAYTSQQVANLSDHTVATLLNEKHERITDLEAELQLARDQDYQREVLAAANRECKRMAQANAELERTIDSQLGFARELAELKTALSAAEAGRDAFATEVEGLRELHRCVVSGPVSKRDEGRCLSLIEERDSLHAEVERLKSELAWVTETELGLTKQNQKLNRAKLQAAYDALAEHCQTAKHPSPLLLAELQSMYRLLEDPA